jgi:hypothetical protein
MSDIAYKPTSNYSPELNTAITKTPLITGLMLFGERVCESWYAASAGTFIIYTVPAGKTFFLTSISGTVITQGANANYIMSVFIAPPAVFASIRGLLQLEAYYVSATINDHSNQTITPAIPIRMTAGEKIGLTTAGTLPHAYLMYTGYLLETAMLPLFS